MDDTAGGQGGRPRFIRQTCRTTYYLLLTTSFLLRTTYYLLQEAEAVGRDLSDEVTERAAQVREEAEKQEAASKEASQQGK